MKLVKSIPGYLPLILLTILVSCGSVLKTSYTPDTSSDLGFSTRDSKGDVVLERSGQPVWDWEQIDLIECTAEPILMEEEKYIKVRITTGETVAWGRKFPQQVDYYEFVVILKPPRIGPHQFSAIVRVPRLGPGTDLLIQNVDGRTISRNPVILRCDWEANCFDLFFPNYLLEKYYLLPNFRVRVEARMKVKENYTTDFHGESFLLDVLLSESHEVKG